MRLRFVWVYDKWFGAELFQGPIKDYTYMKSNRVWFVNPPTPDVKEVIQHLIRHANI